MRRSGSLPDFNAVDDQASECSSKDEQRGSNQEEAVACGHFHSDSFHFVNSVPTSGSRRASAL